MQLSDVRLGQTVMIVAKDEFFAFVHGWTGIAGGVNNGLVIVTARNPDGHPVTLFVPADQLDAI